MTSWASGRTARDEREGLHDHVRALEGLDPAHEQKQRPVAAKTERLAGVAALAWREEGVVHPEGDDLDPARVRPVELDELVHLDGARGEERVGTADDLRLGPRPATGLGALDLFRARLRLDSVEGVEGRDEWQAEAVLYGVARQAREPVVGMDRLRRRVGDAESRCERARHPVDHRLGELLDVLLQSLFGNRERWAG